MGLPLRLSHLIRRTGIACCVRYAAAAVIPVLAACGASAPESRGSGGFSAVGGGPGAGGSGGSGPSGGSHSGASSGGSAPVDTATAWAGPGLVAACDPNAPVAANALFVGPSGSPGAAGTESAPLDLVTAFGRLKAGMTLYLLAGTYHPEKPWIDASGTAEQPIIIKAYRCGKAVLDGAGRGDQGAFLAIWGKHVVIEDLEIANAESRVAMNSYCSHNVFRRNRVHGSRYSALSTYQWGDCDPTDVLFEGNVVYNNVLHNKDRSDTGGWNNAISSSHANAVIRGNLSYENYGEGIVTGGAGPVTVESNIAYDNFATQIYASNSQNARIDGNFVYYTGQGMEMVAFGNLPPNGIQVANENENGYSPPGKNLIVVNNIAVGTRNGFGYGSYQAGGGLDTTVIANNTFYGTLQAALSIDADDHKATSIANNVFYQLPGRDLVRVESTGGLSFTNNLLFGGDGDGGAVATNAVFADPQLSEPGSLEYEGYVPGSGSPVLGGGASVSQVQKDFAGAPRGTPPDIGAFER